MTRAARVVRGTGALILVLLLVVGIPWALSRYIGWPLPRSIPSWERIRDTLDERGIPDDVLLKSLAVVVWLAWGVLVASLVAETAATVRGRASSRVPLAAPLQQVARWLVAAIAIAVLAVSSRPARATPPPSLKATLTSLRQGTAAAVVIANPNHAAPPPESVAYANGDRAPMPATPQAVQYVVRPGDTLWDIAQEHLGDPFRWPEIYQLNRGRPQPDGRSLTDPHWIYPRWSFELPAALAALPAAVPVPSPLVPVPAPPPTTAPPASAPSTTAPESPPPTPASNPAASAEHHEESQHDGTPLPFGIAGGALLAAGATAVLRMLRRRQLQRRQPGHAVPPLTDELARTEAATRAASADSPATWLDAALRSLARPVRAQRGAAPPKPVAARVASTELVVTLAEPKPHAPLPWTTAPPGWQWHLPRAVTEAELDKVANGACAPMPALVTIGRSADGPVMLDLETCGVVSIIGSSDEARALARSAVLELAVSPIADNLDVIVVGDEPLVRPSSTLPRLQLVDSVNAALPVLIDRIDATSKALAHERFASTFAARVGSQGTDPWAPTVLVLDRVPTDRNERERLQALAEPGGRGIGVLAVGDWPDAPWTIQIRDGYIDAPRLGMFGLATDLKLQGIEQRAADATVTVFEQTLTDSAEPLLPVESTLESESDVGEVRDHETPQIDVRVLGQVRVLGATRALSELETELVALLATRERPVDADTVQTALWPDRAVSPKRWWNVVSETRKALGSTAEGEFHFPPVTKGQPLRLSGTVGTDLGQLVAALRRAQREPDRDGISALTRLLQEVDGRPFTTTRGYTWAHANGLASFAEAIVTDAAHLLARYHLEAGDTSAAFEATAMGLCGAPGSEILYRDRMRAHHYAGDTSGVESTMRDLCEALEADDPYADLHPETLTLYEEVSRRRMPAVPVGSGSARKGGT